MPFTLLLNLTLLRLSEVEFTKFLSLFSSHVSNSSLSFPSDRRTTRTQLLSCACVIFLDWCEVWVYTRNEIGKTAQCACVSSASVNLCLSACVFLFLLVAHWPSHPWGELHLVQAVPVSCDWPRPAVFAALQRLQAPQAAGHFPGLSKLMINQLCKSEA